ncbi:MAG: response regulator [Planctomycetes bacterium]|nr:response regulator [Planctomycetota bacterium]
MSTEPMNQESGKPAEDYPKRPEKILVADDEHLVATGMAASLSELGFTVVGPAADGEEAIELCRTEGPDLALLDIRMPKKDGLAVAEIVFRRLGIPVVIFSAYSDNEYVECGNRVGVFGYLLKPVTQDQLRVGISVAWGRFLDAMDQDSEIGRLKERLEARKIVEQAKWVLVSRKGISEPEAMRLLQRQARNNRRPLIEVARSLLENEELMKAE